MNPIKSIAPIVRHVLQLIAGMLVTRGLLDNDTATQAVSYSEEMVGAALSLGTLIWMIRSRRQAPTTQPASTPKNDGAPPAVTAALLVGLLLFGGAGCSTMSTEDRITEMSTVAELAAYTGCRYDLIENPDHRVYYEASVAALGALISAENYDPSAFASALQQLPVRELKDEQGALIVGAAVILWDAYAARLIDLDRTTFVRPVIAATRRGLARALSQ